MWKADCSIVWGSFQEQNRHRKAPFSDTAAETDLCSRRHRSTKIIRMPEGQYQDIAPPQLHSVISPDINSLLIMLKAGNLHDFIIVIYCF